MPYDLRDYPPNWKTELRPAVLARAKNCCECCGVANGEHGARDPRGDWHTVGTLYFMTAAERCLVFGKHNPKTIRIVLTVAHLPQATGPSDDRLEVLIALCQRCHFNLDREDNQQKARATRSRRKADR